MSKRFTVLPCQLKIRITEDDILQLRGDYGAPEDYEERAADFKYLSADFSIDGDADNLQAISDFFAKEVKRVLKEDKQY